MAVESLLVWAGKQEEWQQDALRRVAVSVDLDKASVEAIIANLKHAQGIDQAGETACIPLSTSDLQEDAGEAPLARICSISDVQNVNRLAPDQSLPFALDGITVVYGENGSGKSGYCRIAKKLCRARLVDDLHPNVFEDGERPPGEARVRYQLEGSADVKDVKWVDGQPSPQETAHISVFDSHNARLYIDQKNRIEYLPYELEILTRFGQLLGAVNEEISGEISALDKRLQVALPSGYTPGTEIHTLIAKLNTSTALELLPTAEVLNEQAGWTSELQVKLEKLEKEIGEDPKVLADRCRRVQGTIAALAEEFKTAKDVLSEGQVSKLKEVVTNARTAAEAAALVGTELFRDEPLKHVGSDPWKLMFQHAKAYSQLAYPGKEPPATEPGDLCVLCQQPLQGEAAERLRRFEEFVSGQVQKQAEDAARALGQHAEALRNLKLRSEADIVSLLGEYGQISQARASLAAKAAAYAKAAKARQDTLAGAAASGDFANIPAADSAVIDEMVADKEALSGEATAYEAMAKDDGERQKKQARLATLKDRKKLSGEISTFLERLDDLTLRAKLKACQKAARTNAVSAQVTALRKELVTQDLVKRINAEIEALDLKHIPIQVSDDSRKGESEFAVTLDSKVKVSTRDVLSEGEQRALGLGCFLADVNGQPVKHGIIVDDPVSSLDHVRARRVARRLVQEAANGRQVIIFTHNLLFLSEVQSAAAGHSPQPVPMLTHVVRKSADKGFGIILADDEPWEGKKVRDRIKLVRERLKELDAHPDKGDDSYRRAVKDFYTDLRETWERLVEEVLLFKVVERFGPDVKTQSLKGVEVTDDDYRTIFWAMKHVSERSGHDTAAGKNIPLPTVDEMKADLDQIEKYYSQARKRSNDLSEARKALETAPKAKTA